MIAPGDIVERIGRRIAVTPWLALAAALTLLIASFTLALHNERASREEKLRDVAVQAQILAGSLAGPLAFDDDAATQEYLDALKAKFDVADNRLVIGGFSQGAMISTDVALHRSAPPAGLILMSGTLIAEKIWQPKMHTLSGVPIVQSHGRQDPLLPFTIADALRERLVAAGAKHEWHPFSGGHEIPPPVLQAVSAFVQARAAA